MLKRLASSEKVISTPETPECSSHYIRDQGVMALLKRRAFKSEAVLQSPTRSLVTMFRRCYESEVCFHFFLAMRA